MPKIPTPPPVASCCRCDSRSDLQTVRLNEKEDKVCSRCMTAQRLRSFILGPVAATCIIMTGVHLMVRSHQYSMGAAEEAAGQKTVVVTRSLANTRTVSNDSDSIIWSSIFILIVLGSLTLSGVWLGAVALGRIASPGKWIVYKHSPKFHKDRIEANIAAAQTSFPLMVPVYLFRFLYKII